MRRFIIDTDTASDDSVAIMMAMADPTVTIDALTIVAGNVPLAQASINARYTLELCESFVQQPVPVYEGCDRPWLRQPATADWYHGEDGMGNQHYPLPRRAACTEHAVPELIKRFKEAPGEIELVTLGPLTNLATALSVEPSLAQWVKHCFVMGGAARTPGNVTAAAEYNFWCDPEAAQRVLHSGMPITLLGWELSCDEATLDDAEIEELLALNNPRAHVAVHSNCMALEAARNLQGQNGLALADPVAMSVALDPSLILQQAHCAVTIETASEITRGMSVVDHYNVSDKNPNARVCLSIDIARWKSMLRKLLARQ